MTDKSSVSSSLTRPKVKGKRKKPKSLPIATQMMSTQFDIFRTQEAKHTYSDDESSESDSSTLIQTPTTSQNISFDQKQQQEFLLWSPTAEQLAPYESAKKVPKSTKLTNSTKRTSESTPTLNRGKNKTRLKLETPSVKTPKVSPDSLKSTSLNFSEDSFELPSDCDTSISGQSNNNSPNIPKKTLKTDKNTIKTTENKKFEKPNPITPDASQTNLERIETSENSVLDLDLDEYGFD